MTKAPLVSIGLRVYNGGDLLRHALDSLAMQTHREIEIIIADNASTDNTQQVCRDYARKDKRIRYTRHSSNIGPTANFEYVLKESKGEFFMWASHDDIWDAVFVETLLKVLVLDPELALVAAEAQYMLENGEKLPFFPEGRAFYEVIPYSVADVVSRGYGNLIYGIYRKHFLFMSNKSGQTVLHGMKAETLNELPFYVNLLLNGGKIKVIPTVLLHKRTNLNTYYAASLESSARIKPNDLRRYGSQGGFSPHRYLSNLLEWVNSRHYHREAVSDIIHVVESGNLETKARNKIIHGVKLILWGHYIKVVLWAFIWKMRPIAW